MTQFTLVGNQHRMYCPTKTIHETGDTQSYMHSVVRIFLSRQQRRGLQADAKYTPLHSSYTPLRSGFLGPKSNRSLSGHIFALTSGWQLLMSSIIQSQQPDHRSPVTVPMLPPLAIFDNTVYAYAFLILNYPLVQESAVHINIFIDPKAGRGCIWQHLSVDALMFQPFDL